MLKKLLYFRIFYIIIISFFVNIFYISYTKKDAIPNFFGPENKSIYIMSNDFKFTSSLQNICLNGNVLLFYGELLIKADKFNIVVKKYLKNFKQKKNINNIDEIIITGNVIIKLKNNLIKANIIRYIKKKGLILLEGDCYVQYYDGFIYGEKIIYELKSKNIYIQKNKKNAIKFFIPNFF